MRAAEGARQPDVEPFSVRLHSRAKAADSVICLGLDPRPAAHPLTAAFPSDPRRTAEVVERYLTAILDEVHDLVACCKPQSAFFEALGLPGLESLANVMAHARSLGLPLILDAKRGDIGSTAEAYAEAYLGNGDLGADALTVNPYLGLDSIEPFLAAAEANQRGLFVLVRTSNPGSADLQELALTAGDRVYLRLADALAERAERLPRDKCGYTSLGAVAGATQPVAITELRTRLPGSLLLVPGYGAQGATAADVAHAFDTQGWGAVINASRSLTYPSAAATATGVREVARAARDAAVKMRAALNEVRHTRT